MPIVATATLRGNLAPADVGYGTLAGDVTGGPAARRTGRLAGADPGGPASILTGTVARDVVESLSGPSLMYSVAVKLGGAWIPREELLGPFEIEESLDTIAVLFSFGLAGRRWGIEATSRTWTRTPVEIWVTAGPPGGLRTWLRAFGYVLTCDQAEGPVPTLRISCGDPSILFAKEQLCTEIPTGAGLARGTICADILADLGLDADIPAGALYAKALVTDSARLWDFLAAFGEPEGWFWRFADATTVQAYTADLQLSPGAPDDIWTLGDVVSVQSAPPAESPARWVVRSTQIVDGGGLTIKKTRVEVKGFYAPVAAASRQHADGSITSLDLSTSEVLRTISIQEVEEHSLGTTVVYTVTRDWGWYNPRAAKLRSLGLPPGPVEDGYYYAEAYIDPDGSYRAWPRQAWVQTGEIRVTPSYDANGTEIAGRTETWRWHGVPMGTRNAGSDHPNVLGSGVGDDDRSWLPFGWSGGAGLMRIEDFGLAQVDEVSHEYGEAGAEIRQVEETTAYYSARTAVHGVPWFVNYSGVGQKDLVAPFQLVARKITENILTADALLAGTVESTISYGATRRLGTSGVYDWGDSRSNQQEETLRLSEVRLTTYNVLDEQTYEKLIDGRRELVAGRPPRPRFTASSWTQIVQAPMEMVLDDPAAEAWWGGDTQVLDLPYVQTPAEAESVARRRRARAVCIKHTVVRPICPIRPGQTVLLIDPRAGICHRCLVTERKETWTLAPRLQILATYTLEQPL